MVGEVAFMFQRAIKIFYQYKRCILLREFQAAIHLKPEPLLIINVQVLLKMRNNKLEYYLFFFLIRDQDGCSVLQYPQEFRLQCGGVGGSSKTGL